MLVVDLHLEPDSEIASIDEATTESAFAVAGSLLKVGYC